MSWHPVRRRSLSDWRRGAKQLGDLAGYRPEVDDLLHQGVHANAVSNAAGRIDPAGSRVYFVLPAMGGFSGRGLASLPQELALILKTTKIQSKTSKLAESGLEERHLFLIVRSSAFSWPVYEGLAFGGPLPTTAPLLPDGLSQVWQLTGLQAGGVVRGISGQGWYRNHLPEDLAV